MLEHQAEAFPGNVASGLAIDRVAELHVIRRDRFCDCASGSPRLEKVACDLLSGSDFGERPIFRLVQINGQGLTICREEFRRHGGVYLRLECYKHHHRILTILRQNGEAYTANLTCYFYSRAKGRGLAGDCFSCLRTKSQGIAKQDECLGLPRKGSRREFPRSLHHNPSSADRYQSS